RHRGSPDGPTGSRPGQRGRVAPRAGDGHVSARLRYEHSQRGTSSADIWSPRDGALLRHALSVRGGGRVSQEGGGHGSAPGDSSGVPGVMTFGAPAEGDILAERYRLEEHVDTDAASRQIWRGMDIVLKRPIAIVIRQPGGEAAAAMLDNAFAASRLVHPHLVSVYDA